MQSWHRGTQARAVEAWAYALRHWHCTQEHLSLRHWRVWATAPGVLRQAWGGDLYPELHLQGASHWQKVEQQMVRVHASRLMLRLQAAWVEGARQHAVMGRARSHCVQLMRPQMATALMMWCARAAARLSSEISMRRAIRLRSTKGRLDRRQEAWQHLRAFAAARAKRTSQLQHAWSKQLQQHAGRLCQFLDKWRAHISAEWWSQHWESRAQAYAGLQATGHMAQGWNTWRWASMQHAVAAWMQGAAQRGLAQWRRQHATQQAESGADILGQGWFGQRAVGEAWGGWSRLAWHQTASRIAQDHRASVQSIAQLEVPPPMAQLQVPSSAAQGERNSVRTPLLHH